MTPLDLTFQGWLHFAHYVDAQLHFMKNFHDLVHVFCSQTEAGCSKEQFDV